MTFWTGLWIFGLAGVVLFTFVIAFGAPYLPTLDRQIEPALDLLNLKPGQTLLELGSGDGRILQAAAKRGIKAVGYELNPLLCIISYIKTWRFRDLVTIKMANYWQVKWPPADGIFVFLLQPYMAKLDKFITRQGRPLKLVSFAFYIPDKKAVKQIDGLYLYNYK